MVVPYTKGLSKSFKNISVKVGIQVHFKGDHTIRSILVTPKNKDNSTQKNGVIYRYRCDRLGYDEGYIGESARTSGKRLKEHLRVPSPIYDHAHTSGHYITLEISP